MFMWAILRETAGEHLQCEYKCSYVVLSGNAVNGAANE